MNEERYLTVKSTSDYRIFTFLSQGRHGNLVKIVSFDEITGRNKIFNLALGTMLPDGKIDFVTTTNNGDRNKILVTVADIVQKFIEKHPGNSVYITGSDNRRTLLYQRAIMYGYDELIQTCNIYGESSVEDDEYQFEIFDKTKNYLGFLIERK